MVSQEKKEEEERRGYEEMENFERVHESARGIFNTYNHKKPCPPNDGNSCTQPGCPIGRCCNGKPPNEMGGFLTCQQDGDDHKDGYILHPDNDKCTKAGDVLGFCCNGPHQMFGEYATCPSEKQSNFISDSIRKEDNPDKPDKPDKPVKPVKKEDKSFKKEDKCTLIGITLSSTEWLIIIIICVILLCILAVFVYNMVSSSSNVGTNVVSTPNINTIPFKPKFKPKFKSKFKPKPKSKSKSKATSKSKSKATSKSKSK